MLARPPSTLGSGWPGRLGEALIATWTVAGGLIALVYSSGAAADAVHEAPWLMGSGLWLATALGAGVILRSLPTWNLSAAGIGAATLIGGAADGLVVATIGPWPGLVAAVLVFAAVSARLGSGVKA